MPDTRIIVESCDGCGECVRACPFFAVDIVDGTAVLAESCSDCGICAGACPRGAVLAPGGEAGAGAGAGAGGARAGGGRGVWVWAGGDARGEVDPDAAAVAAAARAVADAEGEPVAAVLPWEPAGGAAALAALGVDEAIIILGAEHPATVAATLAAALMSERPRLLVGSAGAAARRVVAGAAALAGVGFASGVIELEPSGTGVEFTRPIYGGRFTARAAAAVPAACTLDRRAYGRPRGGGTAPPLRTLEVAVEAPPSTGVAPGGEAAKVKMEPQSQPVALAEARLVLAGGTGLGTGAAGTEAFELLARAAQALGGAAAADREAVEARLAASDMLVDAAGHTIAPDVYIALGIDGSPTHNAAIARSKVIVAVTQNQAAPILTVADYVIEAEPAAALRALAGTVGQASR